MSIQFNRENVQSLWDRKAGRSAAGKDPLQPLEQALADNQLTADEYQQLKQAFLKENPQGNFDAFLADALDGQLDAKSVQSLKQALEQLRNSALGSVSLSFNLNAAQDGYRNVAAMTFEKPAAEIYRFVEQADGDKNGRIDASERESLKKALSQTASDPIRQLLSTQLQDQLTTLSYDSASKRITVWLGGDAPRLNTRYKDIHLDLDLSLKDINGITDEARADLSGSAGGSLDFDWNGPLVDSLKRGLVESSSGWAQANARYVPAGDVSGFGPGYVIQLETPKADLPLLGEVGLATRPIVLRSDEQGRLYVASPGFGEGARLWAAEKALNTYALPELRKMGIEMQVSRQNGRLYLTPGSIQLSNLPLSVRGGDQGELHLGLNGQNTRFSVTANGLQIRFSQVPVQGSSNAQGAPASADPQADTLRVRAQVGLNADLSRSLETQVVIENATAQVHLDKGEISSLQALPGHARSLLGDSAEGTLKFRGDYSTNTREHQGQVAGWLDLHSRNSVNGDRAAVFTHFQSQGDTRNQDQGSVSIAGTDLSYTHQGNTARMRTETGALRYQEGKPLRVQLFNAQGDAQVNQETLRVFQQLLNRGGDRAKQLEEAMKAAGISPALLDRLSKGDSAQLRQMLKMEGFVEQLKAVQLQLKAQNWSMDFNPQGYRAQGRNVSLVGRNGRPSATEQRPELKLEAGAHEIRVDSSNWRDIQVQTRQAQIQASAHHQDAASKLSASLSGQAETLDLAATYTEITPDSLSQLQKRLQAGEPLLEKALQELGGLGPQELEALRTQSPVSLVQAREIRAAIEQVGLNRLFSTEFSQVQASLQASAETASGSRLELEARANSRNGVASSDRQAHLEGGSGHLQAQYQDQRGNQAQMQLDLKDVELRLLPDGKFFVKAPDTSMQSQIQTQLEELREALGIIGGEKLQQLLSSGSPQQAREVLQTAGLSAEQARTATDLLWHPQLQTLLRTSEFIHNLNQARAIDFKLSAQGRLQADSSGTRLDDTRLQANGSIRSATGQELLAGEASLSQGQVVQSQGQTKIHADQATARLQAHRADGSDFLSLQARAEAFLAQLGAGQKSLETGRLELQGEARSHLDAAKVAEIRDMLKDFKGKLQNRLQELGLSRKQFERFVQAFGQQQLSQLFSSANLEQLATLTRDLGVSPDQVERMMGLLNDQTFSRLADHIYQFTQLLENAEATLEVKGSAARSQLTMGPEGQLARLEDLQGLGTLRVSGVHGQAEAQLQGSQEYLEIQHHPRKTQAEWGTYTAQVQAQAQQADQNLKLKGQAQGGAGHYVREGQEVRTRLSEARATIDARMRRSDGSTSSLQTEGRYTAITSRRRTDQPENAEVRVEGLQQRASAELHDQESAQTTRVEAEAGIERLTINPQQVRFEQTRLRGEAQTQRQGQNAAGQATIARAQGEGQLEIETLTSQEGQVAVDQARLAAKARTTLERQGQRESDMGVQLENGRITHLRAQKGQVSLEQAEGQLRGDLNTPVQTGKIQGHLHLSDVQAHEGVITASSFSLDQVQGQLRIKSEKLGQILSNSPDARRILETIYARWGQQGAPGLFSNETVTIQLDQASLQGRSGTANALTAAKDLKGRLRFPDLETQLGDAKVQLQFNRLSLSPDDRPPEVEVTGHASFQPKQPDFNQAIQRLVTQQLQQLGVRATVQVYFTEGRFQVSIDHALADGVVSVRTRGDSIELSIDKAKLFGFISARGLATRIAESQVNNYLLDLEREDQTLRLSLNEITDHALHRDNLQIRRLSISPAGQFEVDFAYTDTPQYNAAARERDQAQLEQRLFKNPRTGQARTPEQLEDLVEDLAPAVVQKIFREASAEQLERILASVGKDRDWLVRERALAGVEPKDYSRFPAENRAVMARHLTDTSGLFNDVDSREEKLLLQLLQTLKKPDADRFMQTLSQDQLTRILHEMADYDPQSRDLPQLLGQLYQQLEQPEQRNKLRLAIERGLDENAADAVLNALRAAHPREFTSLTGHLSRIQNSAKLKRAVEGLNPSQLQEVFRQAEPGQLRRMLVATGTDADTLLKKGLQGITDFRAIPVQNRGVMAAFLSRSHGLFDSVDPQEQQLIRALAQNLRPTQRQALLAALSPEERHQLQKYLNP